MATPPLPAGFVLQEPPKRRDPVETLRAEGFEFTNGFRTPADVERIRAQGYTPAQDGAHNRGDGVDLIHPGLTPAQQKRRLEELFGDWDGAKVLDEGHHRHLQLPGWRAAPGTPGTPNSGLPPLPPGFELNQRGSLQGGNFVQADAVRPPAAAPNGMAPPAAPSSAPSPPGNGRGYRTNVDPAIMGQLQTALDGGESYSSIRARAQTLGVTQDATFLSDLQNAVRWRDTNKRRGARFVPADARPIPKPVPPDKAPGLPNRLVAAADRGLANILGAPVDLVNAGMGAVGIPVSDTPFLGSESWKDIMGLPGYLVEGRPYDFDHPLLAPQSTAERYAQRGIQFVAENSVPALGIIGKGGQIINAGRAGVQGGNAFTQAGRTLAVEAARRPGVTLAGEAGASVGAAVGGEAARDIVPDSAAGELGGQLVGGLIGGLSAGGAAANVRPRAPTSARQPLPAMPEGFQLAEGPHGPIHRDLAGDYPAALARLRADQAGEVPGAIRHPELGAVDLVWGDGNYGLSKIVQRHPEVVDDLPAIVERLPVRQRPEETGNNRFVLEDDTHRAVVAPDFNGVEQRWLVTAFERKGAPGNLTSRRDPLSPDGGSTGGGAADDILPNASQRNAQADVGQLWRLSRDDLESLAAEKGTSDQDKLLQALGSPEAVKRFNALDRMRNSSDPQRSDEGSRLFDDEFGNLTPEQERLVYGIGETDASLDDIRALISAHSDVMSGDDVDWSSYMAAVAARRVQPEEFAKVLSGEGSIAAQAAFVRMGAAYENMRASGVPTGDIPRLMVAALVERGGWDADDAAEVIGSFVRGVEDLRGASASPRPAIGQSASMASGIKAPTLASPTPRTVDRIDIGAIPEPPPGFVLADDPAIGRVRPLGDQASADDIAAAARRIGPEDVMPGPTSRPLTQEDVEAAHDASWRDVPGPAVGRRSRKPSSVVDYVKGWVQSESSAKGMPVRIDAEDAISHGVPAEYIYVNPTVADRSKLRLRNPSIFGTRYGSMSRTQQHLRSLDQLDLDPVAWGFDEKIAAGRLEPEDIGDLLRRGLEGDESAFNRADPGYGGWREYQERLSQRAEFDGRFPDKPPVERLGEPITADDLDNLGSPATAYEDLPRVGGRVANINLEHLESRSDIRRALQNTELMAGGFDAARRGRVTQAETAALASELNMTPADLLRRRRGQALNAEQALQARRILAKSADELVTLANKVAGGSDDELVAFRKAWVRHVAIQEQVTGATAEAGRALASFRIAARSKEARVRVLQGLVEGSGGKDRLEDVAQAIIDLQRDPTRLNRFARDAIKPKMKDKLVELWYNWLLSGPQTHVVNTVSNTLTSLGQIPEHAAAAGLGLLRSSGGKALSTLRRVQTEQDVDRVLFSEVGARATGLLHGVREGLRQAGRTFRTGEPSDQVTKVEQMAQRAVSGKKGEILRIPTRALAAEDELFKAMARRMELTGLAVRQAGKEGLSGAEAKARAAELVANPTEEMLLRSFEYGRYLTFQRQLGPVGQSVSRMTSSMPILKLVLPFVRTPTNLLKFTIERSPAAPLLKEWRADIRAGGARRDLAAARVMIGSGVGAMVAQWAAEGLITGGGPADENAKQVLRADGWQPYSIRLGGKYYSYQRLDPFASTLGVAADLASKSEYMTEKQREHTTTLLVTSIMQQIQSKTWLSGLSDLTEAINDPDRFAQSFIARLSGSLAVPAGVAQVARTVDPILREARSPLDRIKSRIPGLSRTLPARRDMWGREMRSEGGAGPDILSPIWVSTRRNDPVNKEMLAIGARFGKPQRQVGGRTLTPAEFSRYQEMAGRYTYEDIRAALADPEWARLPREDRVDWVDDIKRDARRDAREELFSTPPPLPPGFQMAR